MTIFTDEQKQKVESLVRSCGSLMLSALCTENDSSVIKEKNGDANFVTVFDEQVQDSLIKGISEIFPDAVFFAEEKDNSAEDVKNGRCFIIDPIDGTTNFIHSMGASTISVAMLVDGVPVFGVVYDPYRDDYFCAQSECGAYMNGERIFVSERYLEHSVVAFGTTPYKKSEYAEKGFLIAKNIFMNCSDIRRSGSAALDMAYVACGKLDGFFECVLSPWDYAAGYVLIKEAGGTVTDFNGTDIGFSAPSPIICSNRLIHNKLSALINNI